MVITGKGGDQSTSAANNLCGHPVSDEFGDDNFTASNKHPSAYQGDETLTKMQHQGETSLQSNTLQQEPLQVRQSDWARVLEAATQRRTEVLTPENLENMWTKGTDYKKRENKHVKAGSQDFTDGNLAKDMSASKHGDYTIPEGKYLLQPVQSSDSDPLLNVGNRNWQESSQDLEKELSLEGVESKTPLKRSNHASEQVLQLNKEGGPIVSESQSHDFERHNEGFWGKSASDMFVKREGQLVPKLRCRVCILGYNNYGM